MNGPLDSYGFQERLYAKTTAHQRDEADQSPRLFITTPAGEIQRWGPPGFFGWERAMQVEYLAKFEGWKCCSSGRPDGCVIHRRLRASPTP